MVTRIGSQGDDTTDGTVGADLILGLGGDDTLIGHGGSDVILAGAGDDLIGGENLFLPGKPFDEGASGPYAGDPTLGNNLILAGSGNDIVRAGYGADTIFGGAGDDVIIGYGDAPTKYAQSVEDGGNLLFGDAGDDSIQGGIGRDLIVGGSGKDTIFGGGGVDTLAGGAGRDVFAFAFGPNGSSSDTGVGPGNRDIILDFHEGTDRIDLRGYLNPFPGPDGQLPSIFLGDKPFEASLALQIRIQIEGGHTLVQLASYIGYPGPDVPPPQPDRPFQEIELAGVHHLTAGDFILA